VLIRCAWANVGPLEQEYHDTEWGVPLHEDRLLFEFLILEGVQAGLSWVTIFRKREGHRRAFDGFEPEIVVSYDQHKVEAAVHNAGEFLKVRDEFGTFETSK